MSLIDLEDFRISRPHWGRCEIADYFKKISYDKFKKDLEKIDMEV